MADDQPPQRVHFNEQPVSNVLLFGKGPPPFNLVVTPPIPTSSTGPRDASDLSPTRARSERNFLRVRSPTPYPTRLDRSFAIDDSSYGNNDSSFEGNGTSDQQIWSQEQGSDAIEANRISQTQSASLLLSGTMSIAANPLNSPTLPLLLWRCPRLPRHNQTRP